MMRFINNSVVSLALAISHVGIVHIRFENLSTITIIAVYSCLDDIGK
jgi:hypothetical protein